MPQPTRTPEPPVPCHPTLGWRTDAGLTTFTLYTADHPRLTGLPDQVYRSDWPMKQARDLAGPLPASRKDHLADGLGSVKLLRAIAKGKPLGVLPETQVSRKSPQEGLEEALDAWEAECAAQRQKGKREPLLYVIPLYGGAFSAVFLAVTPGLERQYRLCPSDVSNTGLLLTSAKDLRAEVDRRIR